MSAGFSTVLAIFFAPLSSYQPSLSLREVEDVPNEWKAIWTWRKRKTPDIPATVLYCAPYTEGGDKNYDETHWKTQVHIT
jgi:hypothetical protein